VRAEGERRPGSLDGTRTKVGVLQPVVPAGEGRRSVAQQRVHDLHRLVEPADQLARRGKFDPELLVLGNEPAGPETQLETSVGDMIDGHGLVREEGGVTEVVAAHQHADPDALGPRGEGGEHRPPFVEGAGRSARLIEVVAVPDAVEAEALEVLPALDERGPGQVLVGAESEAHRARRRGHLDPHLWLRGRWRRDSSRRGRPIIEDRREAVKDGPTERRGGALQCRRMARPLEGLTALDLATFVAAPFCCTLLGEFGAEVIKVEQPGAGDDLRRLGRASADGPSYLWLVEARNKKSITCNLRTAEGQALVKRLAGSSDVVAENFRPGTLERWHLGWEDLHAANRGLVLVRISAFGQTGPERKRPGFRRIAAAGSGARYRTAHPDRAPVPPGPPPI